MIFYCTSPALSPASGAMNPKKYNSENCIRGCSPNKIKAIESTEVYIYTVKLDNGVSVLGKIIPLSNSESQAL
jgi:hypothetical protein